jgi:hypothetical protein
MSEVMSIPLHQQIDDYVRSYTYTSKESTNSFNDMKKQFYMTEITSLSTEMHCHIKNEYHKLNINEKITSIEILYFPF